MLAIVRGGIETCSSRQPSNIWNSRPRFSRRISASISTSATRIA
jgi:pyridoxine/pyridoxamine 5'-phosphate oxidase